MATLPLNCQNLNCPMPIVELTKTARLLQPGDTIEVTATDLAFRPDLEAWARRMKHTIAEFVVDGPIQRAVVVVGGQEYPKKSSDIPPEGCAG